MTRIECAVTIERPLQEVWDFVLDSRNDPVWQTNVVEVGNGADRPVEVGVEIEETFGFLGRRLPVTLVVTEHEPTRHSAVEVTAGPVPGRGSYDFEAAGVGTRFTYTLETDAHGLFKLAEPVFARMARRDVATSCEHLKDLLESRNDSRTDGP
jgi:Polyketide cyclase / dehydrase and lipid transport